MEYNQKLTFRTTRFAAFCTRQVRQVLPPPDVQLHVGSSLRPHNIHVLVVDEAKPACGEHH